MPPLNSPAVPSPGLAGTVHAGKVKVTGGFDDLCKEASYEFGNMNATSNSETELAMGCEPMEMSQPTILLRSFCNVKTLCADDGLIEELSHCLGLEDRELPLVGAVTRTSA